MAANPDTQPRVACAAPLETAPFLSFILSLLAILRPAHLPTIISSCIAGWWLAGGSNIPQVIIVFTGATLIFLGGAFLNDAFDIHFDRRYRRARPIPAGHLRLRHAWHIGLALLLAGALLLQWPNRLTALLTLALAATVILHNALHRAIPIAPLTMAGCRFLLYTLGASVASQRITGAVLWAGLAIAFYTAGLELLARQKPAKHRPSLITIPLLLAPILLAALINTGAYMSSALLFASLLLAWNAWIYLARTRSLHSAYPTSFRSLLIPGIVLADILAACVSTQLPWHAPLYLQNLILTFLALFLLSATAAWTEYRFEPQHQSA